MTSDPGVGTRRPGLVAADGPPRDSHSSALTDTQRRLLLTVGIVGAAAPVVVGVALFVPDAGGLLSSRQFWFLVHLGFGIIMVHGFAGGLTTLLTRRNSPLKEAVRLASTAALALVSWATVISGTWLVYPAYRANLADGADPRGYPKQYLKDNDLYFWHSFGMEWKEHVGWVTPLLTTAVAYIAYRHGDLVARNPQIRAVTTAFFAIGFLAALVAAGLGAAINIVAPNDFLRE